MNRDRIRLTLAWDEAVIIVRALEYFLADDDEDRFLNVHDRQIAENFEALLDEHMTKGPT